MEKKNITTLTNLDSQRLFLEETLNHLPLVFYSKNRDGVFLKVNQMFRELFKLTDEQIIGKSNHDIFPKNIADQFYKNDLETFNSAQLSVSEEIAIDSDGNERTYKSYKFPYFDKNGEVYAIGGCSVDITFQIYREKKLDIALKKAEEATKAKSDFLSAMSHEIRTPLNGIIGIASLFTETNLSNEQKEFLKAIEYSSKSLLKIVNDILDFSKIEAGAVELEEEYFNLNQFLSNALKPFSFLAQEKGLDFKIIQQSVDYEVYGDRGHLEKILNNLVSNAIKFTEKGEIKVEMNAVLLKSNVAISLIIQDTGIGIPEIYKKNIFNSFSQADSGITREYGGTGLGLSITKKLIDHLQGEISYKSEVNQGTTFVVNLKLDKGKALDGLSKVSENKNFDELRKFLKNFRILVAEDNSINRFLIENYLEKIGVKYKIVSNGIEVMDALNESNFDLILMDIQMPLKDGYATAKEIRCSNKNFSKIPIVAVTANVIKGEKQKCLDAGMNAYISKPFSVDELIETINQFVEEEIHFESIFDHSKYYEIHDKEMLNELRIIFDNDQKLIEYMLKVIEQNNKNISEIIELYRLGQYKDVAKTSHSIRPSIKQLGGVAFADYLQSLELSGGSYQDIKEIITKYHIDFIKFLEDEIKNLQ